MTRTKNSIKSKKQHKKTLKKAKSFWGSQSKLFKIAKQRTMQSDCYSYSGRKKKKKDNKKIWTSRINSSIKIHCGIKLKYNKFINYLKKTQTPLNKKVLSNFNIYDSNCFSQITKPLVKTSSTKNNEEGGVYE